MTARNKQSANGEAVPGRAASAGNSWTIRRQLLLSVNITLAVLLAGFLTYEYHRAFSSRLADKHSSLQEEAVVLAEGVARLRHHGLKHVQQYLDAVCSRMQDSVSPGHHLAVTVGETTVQARAHHRASPNIIEAMRSAARSPHHRAAFGDGELIVGSARRDGVGLFVSEYVQDIRSSVLGDIVRHLAAIALGGILAAAIVNAVLVRLVDNPLRRLARTVAEIGQGRFGLQAGRFKCVELNRLAEVVDGMSSSLAVAEKSRRSQMRKARRIQQHLLPEHLDVPGLELTHLYRPAEDVSGDYYDVFRLPDETWLLVIADVVGHGVPAAMTAAILKMLLEETTALQTDPARILTSVNRRFTAATLEGDFASVFLARWSPETGRLEYANAGHGTAWLTSANGRVRRLPATGLLIGVDEDATWQTEAIDVVTGDRLLLATDGVTETTDSQNTLFGADRLTDMLHQGRTDSIADQVGRIEEALDAHRASAHQKDDVTMILAEFTAAHPMAGASIRRRIVG